MRTETGSYTNWIAGYSGSKKGLQKNTTSQIGSFLDGWTVIDYNERNDGIPPKTFKSEDTCMMNRGALELAAGREV